MRAALIENGVVVNVIEVENLGLMPGLVAAGEGDICDLWDGVSFTKPAPPVETDEEYNEPILAELAEIDAKSIRALRDGDDDYIAQYSAAAADLRALLR